MFRSLRSSLLSIGFAGMAATLFVLAQALWSFHTLDHKAREAMVGKDLVADILPPPMYLIELRLVVSKAVEGSLPVADAQNEVARLAKEYGDRVDYWSVNPPFGLERQLLGRQHTAAKELLAAARTEVIDRLVAGDVAGARAGLKAVDAIYAVHRAAVDETVRAGNEFAARSVAQFDATQARGMWLIPASALVLLMLTFVCYVLARASILRPLGACAELAGKVAAGDLTAAIASPRRDEIGQLTNSLASMVGRLRNTLGQVVIASSAVTRESTELHNEIAGLSRRTEQQAANLEETAATMEELTATVKQNADNARQANQLAISASGVASKGGAVVGDVVTTMDAITTSSKRIADIIGVIDGIAFQTNILALNAAVEAARAGEQGRGFAVVAAEVRNLAQRSANAAREIKDLISASVGSVESGARLVAQAGETIDEVVHAVKRVTDIMSEISAASQEQASGLDQVGQAVAQLDQITQQNAGLVQAATASAEELAGTAGGLARALGDFRVEATSPQQRHADCDPAATGVPDHAPAGRVPSLRRQGSAAKALALHG